jgi:hypothetical protein
MLSLSINTAPAKMKKLIPRPKGQAGRLSGYNLQMEMGLDADSERYNRLVVRDVLSFIHTINSLPLEAYR